MNPQLDIDFVTFVNAPVMKEPRKDTGIYRLLDLLRQRPVTCQDLHLIGIAGSALSKRVDDLVKKYGYTIHYGEKEITAKFSGKKVKITEYTLIK